MSDNITNELLYETLKAIRGDVAALRHDTRDLKGRIASLEAQVVGMRTDISLIYGELVRGTGRHDSLADRVERIEQRLELTEG